MDNNRKIPERTEQQSGSKISRKNFFKYAGATAVGAVAIGLYGCDDDGPTSPPMEDAVNLGTGNVAILNYAYALEQLEAAFYVQVMDNRFSGMTDEETNILGDLRDHEVVHRDFFQVALGDSAIPGLTPNFGSIDFSSRSEVLGTAKTFEDLGVSAYNGQGRFIDTSSDAGLTYLLLAGKIVSVEARHASAIRDLINPLSADFAGDDIIDNNGLEQVNNSSAVLSAAGNFIEEEIDFSGMPDQQ